MLSSIIAALLGIATGTLTGITPGLHINLVASIIAGSAAALTKTLSPFDIGVYLLTMSITHTFLDAVPAVFLGVAEGSELLSLLPSQRLVLQGRGMQAIFLLTFGALGCLLLSTALIPVLMKALPWAYYALKPHMGIVLIILTGWMLLREREPNILFWSFIIVLASAALGLITLRSLNLDDPLLPMLSGLFGISGLVHALVSSTQLPPQGESVPTTGGGKNTLLSLGSGTVAGSVIALLPGLGPAQAAVMARAVLPRLGEEAFLILNGGINTVNMALSLVTMSALGFARNGSLEVMLSIVKRPDAVALCQYAATGLVAGGIAAILTMKLGKKVGTLLPKTNYAFVSAGIIAMVSGLVFWRTGLLGLLILLTATAIGLVAILTGAPRHHLMACIIVPVIWATA